MRKFVLAFWLILFVTCCRCAIHLDTCNTPLGMESGAIPSSRISASSSHSPATVGADQARLNLDTGGGAWCPKGVIDSSSAEFLQVDLGGTKVVTAILSQGRFGNGHGQEFAESFTIQYSRSSDGDNFTGYVGRGGKTLFAANKNTYSVEENQLDPPLIARRIRILPYSKHPRTVCMRLEIVGCDFTDGVLSYRASQPYQDDQVKLADDSFDGFEVGGLIGGGLGQLVDGVKTRVSIVSDESSAIIGGYAFVGWKNESLDPIQVEFAFDAQRQFDSVTIITSSPEGKADERSLLGIITKITLECGTSSDKRLKTRFDFSNFATADELVLRPPKDGACIGDRVSLSLFFEGKWLAITEIEFESAKTDDIPATTEGSWREDDQAAAEMQPAEVDSDGGQAREWWGSRFLGVAIGILVTVIVLLVVIIVFILHRDKTLGKHCSGSSSETRIFFPSTVKSSRFHNQDEEMMTTAADSPNYSPEPIYSEPLTENNVYADKPRTIYSDHTPNLAFPDEYSSSLFGHLNDWAPHTIFSHSQDTAKWSPVDFFAQPPPSSVVPCYASTDVCQAMFQQQQQQQQRWNDNHSVRN